MSRLRQDTRVAEIEAIPVNVDYLHQEISSIVSRSGVTQTLVKVSLENGLIGWGEATRCADANGIIAAITAMRPFVIGRDIFADEAILQQLWIAGGWHLQPMTGNLAYAGIDMALWDLKGKVTGLPVHDLIGGPMRKEVDYYYYLPLVNDDDMRRLCRDGVQRDFGVFYVKVGTDAAREEEYLAIIREELGPDRQIRIDANQAWSIPEAIRILNRWHDLFAIDLIEAPVCIDDLQQMHEVKARTKIPISINEGLWNVADAHRIIQERPGDYLCFSSYWVGSIRRFMNLAWLAHHKGWRIIKHTHGELGLGAYLGQHLMLTTPNADVGHQHTAAWMRSDIIVEPLPPADRPRWGHINRPGLGATVDESKVKEAHQQYQKHGAIPIHDEQ